jgi:hypothetical protein
MFFIALPIRLPVDAAGIGRVDGIKVVMRKL